MGFERQVSSTEHVQLCGIYSSDQAPDLPQRESVHDALIRGGVGRRASAVSHQRAVKYALNKLERKLKPRQVRKKRRLTAEELKLRALKPRPSE